MTTIPTPPALKPIQVGPVTINAPVIREPRQSGQMAEWDITVEPVSMQLVGCDPESMGEAAKLQEGNGAAIIDINFGCPER